MSVAYIAIGSNLGNKEENFHKAMALLENKGVKIKKVSSFISTKPYGVLDQPDFLNGAFSVEFSGSARELLELLLTVEKEMGRERKRHWGERNIDLDLIFFGEEIITEQDLIIPHPDMANRQFVLEPLAEIAPNLVHPILKKTMQELLKNLGGNKQ